MKRHLLNLLTGLSLLVCVALAPVWVRSYWVNDAYRWSRHADDPATAAWTALSSMRGVVLFNRGHVTFKGDSGADLAQRMRQFELGRTSRPLPRMGFGWWGLGVPFATTFTRDELTRRSSDSYVTVPYWLIAVPAVILCATRLARYVRSRRPRPGMCPRCGYDLRATPEGCPECGIKP